jgi:hypothetical protein
MFRELAHTSAETLQRHVDPVGGKAFGHDESQERHFTVMPDTGGRRRICCSLLVGWSTAQPGAYRLVPSSSRHDFFATKFWQKLLYKHIFS